MSNLFTKLNNTSYITTWGSEDPLDWTKVSYSLDIRKICGYDSEWFIAELNNEHPIYSIKVTSKSYDIDDTLGLPKSLTEAKWSESRTETLKFELKSEGDSLSDLQKSFDRELSMLTESFGLNFTDLQFKFKYEIDSFDMSGLLHYGSLLGVEDIMSTKSFIYWYDFLLDRAYQSAKVPIYLCSNSVDYFITCNEITKEFDK